MKIKEIFNKITKTQKMNFLIFICIITIVLSIAIPCLSRFKNRSSIVSISAWDGSVATSYRSGTGTTEDPYIISNGSELAYFSEQLKLNDYENTYFKLNNDIALNKGVFTYDNENSIEYILDNNIYYVKPYTNELYLQSDYSGNAITDININLFNSLNNFKGSFVGESYTIYGLYITNSVSNELGLFTNLNGDISDLYVTNSLIYGGNITGGIVGTAKDSKVSNTLFNGYVIGNDSVINEEVNNEIQVASLNYANGNLDITSISLPILSANNVKSSSLTGTYTITDSSNDTVIYINDNQISNGTINLDLGQTVLTELNVSVTSTSDATITFNNLSYNVTYNNSVASGIIANANNVTLENVINKGYIESKSVSGGLIGTGKNINVNKSYNLGTIISDNISGGIVGNITNDSNVSTIDKVYNSGDVTGNSAASVIGSIDNTNININNTLSTKDNLYNIDSIKNSTVNITNSYYTGTSSIKSGTSNGDFVYAALENMQNKNTMITVLGMNEYIDENDLSTNTDNVWVYEDNSLPILFIDDINNPIANIYASTYSWNNFSTSLNNVTLSNNISFTIGGINNLKPLKDIYYYISDSKIPLSLNEVENITTWNTYSEMVKITDEGFYVIYAKVVDYDNNVTYLNSDLMILDLTGSDINIILDDNSWNDLSSNNNIYINSPKNVFVTAEDTMSGIASIMYYKSEDNLTKQKLDLLTEDSWSNYTESGINIESNDKNIIYIKVVDNSGYITYASTDKIIFNGYDETLSYGYNGTIINNAYITDKSSITISSKLDENTPYLDTYTHNLISSIVLPVNTKITITDNVTSTSYEYITTSDNDYGYENSCNNKGECTKYAVYSFTLFKEIGNVNEKSFDESKFYNNNLNEDFNVTVDFINTDITKNYLNTNMYLSILDTDKNIIISTLTDEVKDINIYTNTEDILYNASLSISSDYKDAGIILNSDSENIINLSSRLVYEKIDENTVMDTTYEDKKLGLSIKLLDVNDNITTKKYLKNITFKIGDTEYIPDNEGIILISLDDLNDKDIILNINTESDNINLKDGSYKFRITNYAAYDGLYYDEINESYIDIPVFVSRKLNSDKYNFNVYMEDSSKIISKSIESALITFNIIQNGELSNPNVKVSLYQKTNMTAFNQDYTLVDLANYSYSNLDKDTDKVYFVFKNMLTYNGTSSSYNVFNLSLLPSSLNKTGYKLVFTLYDGDKKIGVIEKYFIVK